MITKDEFLKLAERCFVTKKKYMQMVNIALDSGLINLEECENNFSAVYPVATAIYEKETQWFLSGSSDESWRRKARRLATNLRQMFYHPAYYIENFYNKYKHFN